MWKQLAALSFFLFWVPIITALAGDFILMGQPHHVWLSWTFGLAEFAIKYPGRIALGWAAIIIGYCFFVRKRRKGQMPAKDKKSGAPPERPCEECPFCYDKPQEKGIPNGRNDQPASGEV